MPERVYADHAASSPLRPEALAAMMPWLTTRHGNPSSQHQDGQRARDAVETARAQVARRFGRLPSEVIFTSGATEALNLVIRAFARPGTEIVASAVEHPAVMETCRQGPSVLRLVGVDPNGRLTPFQVAENTALVVVMAVNNETGVRFSVPDVDVPVLVDAVQSGGRGVNADLVAVSAHKLGGPQGVGALLVKRGVAVTPSILGGAQERGRRGGTENVAGIVGFGAACELPWPDLTLLDAELCRGLRALGGEVAGTDRRPGIVNVAWAGVDAEDVLIDLDLAGISASSGSACASGSRAPSHVLTAMGQTPQHVGSSVRFSLGPASKTDDVHRVLHVLAEILQGDSRTVR